MVALGVGKEVLRILNAKFFQLRRDFGVSVGVGFEDFKESLSALLAFQSDFANHFVSIVDSRFAKQNVGRLGKNAAFDFSAGVVQVALHAFAVGLQAAHDGIHSGDGHRKARHVVGDKALARAVCKVSLVLAYLVHVERDDARAHRLPQRLYVLAVPGIALLRHCRRADLGRSEVLKDFSDFAPLQVAKVVGKVRDDSKGHVHLKQKAQEVFRLDKLVGIFARLQAQKAQVSFFQFLWVLDNHAGAVVRAYRACKLSLKLLAQFLDAQD